MRKDITAPEKSTVIVISFVGLFLLLLTCFFPNLIVLDMYFVWICICLGSATWFTNEHHKESAKDHLENLDIMAKIFKGAIIFISALALILVLTFIVAGSTM